MKLSSICLSIFFCAIFSVSLSPLHAQDYEGQLKEKDLIINDLRTKIDDLKRQLREGEKNSKNEEINILSQKKEIETLNAKLKNQEAFYEDLIGKKNNQISTYEDKEAELEQKQALISKQEKDIDSLKEENKEQENKINESKKEKNQLLKVLEDTRNNQNIEKEEFRKLQKKLEHLNIKIEKQDYLIVKLQKDNKKQKAILEKKESEKDPLQIEIEELNRTIELKDKSINSLEKIVESKNQEILSIKTQQPRGGISIEISTSPITKLPPNKVIKKAKQLLEKKCDIGTTHEIIYSLSIIEDNSYNAEKERFISLHENHCDVHNQVYRSFRKLHNITSKDVREGVLSTLIRKMDFNLSDYPFLNQLVEIKRQDIMNNDMPGNITELDCR